MLLTNSLKKKIHHADAPNYRHCATEERRSITSYFVVRPIGQGEFLSSWNWPTNKFNPEFCRFLKTFLRISATSFIISSVLLPVSNPPFAVLVTPAVYFTCFPFWCVIYGKLQLHNFSRFYKVYFTLLYFRLPPCGVQGYEARLKRSLASREWNGAVRWRCKEKT